MRIRPYSPSDWESVCTVYDLSKPDELQGEVGRPVIFPLNEDPKMKTLFDKSTVLVAEQESTVVGFAGRREEQITWLFVHPKCRRTGIAEQLLRRLVNSSDDAPVLNVAKSNHAAVRLYEKLGFILQFEFTGHFNDHPIQVLRFHRPRAA